MNWKTIAVAATRESIDSLEELLWEQGAVSVTVEDGGDSPLFEPGPAETPLWDTIIATGLFEQDIDPAGVRETLDAAGFSVLYADELADRVWEREWLERFKPMQFGNRLWVCPTGHEVPAPDAIVMNLDPGLAFGTGTHPTTHLCLAWLDGHVVPGERVMDFGCGSGILGIAALLLGAREVVAVDNDPQAVTATVDNAERNGVDDRLHASLPAGEPQGQYDLVIANILAQPLVDLAPHLTELLGGREARLVLSGIMASQVEWVASAYPALAFEAPVILDDWVCLVGKLR